MSTFKNYKFCEQIAKGLSPLNPDSVGIKPGRLMLERISELMNNRKSFAFETTLATKSDKNLITKAKEEGYKTTLLFLYLETFEMAKERVRNRVTEGGHNIPEKVIERRYETGLKNFFNIYQSIIDEWLFFDNSNDYPILIATKNESDFIISEKSIWEIINSRYGK